MRYEVIPKYVLRNMSGKSRERPTQACGTVFSAEWFFLKAAT
ncbi:hypothetical protein SBDP1_120026 [Syntrophobacter sp. SbD1]|nr:hypothetical protein SBDP1_120026 [Syntrophobacter sp. SbD1]